MSSTNVSFADVREHFGLFLFPLVCSQQSRQDEQSLPDCLLYRLIYSCQFILVVLLILPECFSWGKGYFIADCLAKRKELKKCKANKLQLMRQAFGSWIVLWEKSEFRKQNVSWVLNFVFSLLHCALARWSDPVGLFCHLSLCSFGNKSRGRRCAMGGLPALTRFLICLLTILAVL